ncbi:MAG TPA: Rieske 2Fe-2S domain-containing protein [Acidimicrobiales bacterium]|nr:Rieske 2Fe-2S domain-containing protein [Acidimicrobiales bacterium]
MTSDPRTDDSRVADENIDDRPALRSPASQHPPQTGKAVLTKRGQRAERSAATAFFVSMLAALGLAVVYWEGGQPQLEGILLAVALGGIGTGIVLWAKHFMPSDEVEEDRHPLESTEEVMEAYATDFEAGESSLRSRRLLIATGGGACAALGLAVLFPIRSLGPRPGRDLKRTPFAEGNLRVVREDGSPIRPENLPDDGFVTAWPDGHTDAADAPTLLIRLREDQEFRPREGREDWTVDNVVAFSKLCTHAGCPVGLYQAEIGQLLCPCHQSTFDVLDSCRPIFGPAARSLPQLPLALDREGYLIATGDFSDPTGPGFWDRDR